MANPTSNFGWQMPTPVDLVTDLPADFEVFGQAVDSSLADLKGGTSGQILSKNSNTDMDFVWITNDVGDITAVTAGTGISGGGSSGAVTITNSMATEIAAKGDLIAGTGSQTFDNLTVGANGTVLVADSSASTGLKYAPAGNWHGARVIKTTTQTLANNVEVAITFDNEIYDTDGYHDNTTNNTRCTVPTGLGGIYLVTGYITYDSNATGARYVVLTKNGGIDAYSVIDASGSGETMFVTSQIIALAAGDFIELKGIQTSGGNLGIKGGQVFYSGLSLALIGA